MIEENQRIQIREEARTKDKEQREKEIQVQEKLSRNRETEIGKKEEEGGRRIRGEGEKKVEERM